MNKNTLYIIVFILTLVFYYLFYEYQNRKFNIITEQLYEMNRKLDSIELLKQHSPLENSNVNYKENNIVKDKIVNFADSLAQLLEQDTNYQKVSKILTVDQKETEPIADTLCYELSEQYKIISFYNNKIRVQNILKPGSFILSLNDSIAHNDNTYILDEINGQGSYVKLHNVSKDGYCRFHKIKP
tara:strand:+ start:240 stop:794 length:555 start_codon:yes stop_codon:yes gene_type:complete